MRNKTNKICVNRRLLFLGGVIFVIVAALFFLTYNTLNKPATYSTRASFTEALLPSPTPATIPVRLNPAFIADQLLTQSSQNNLPIILSLLFRANLEQMINVADVIQMSPSQRTIVTEVLASNAAQAKVNSGLIVDTYIGLSQCADSRCVAPLTLVTKQSGLVLFRQAGDIAAQPTLFADNTVASFFISHVNTCDVAGGCGALGGIQKLLAEDEGALLAHHVPPATIDELKALITLGARDNAKDWASLGARIQADMNNHQVVAIVNGHADGTFIIQGVALPGNPILQSIDNYPALKEIAALLHSPTEVNAALAAGQAPKAIIMNFTRRGSPEIFGNLQQTAGSLFKVSTSDLSGARITMDGIDGVAAGAGYGLRALENGRVAFITADTVEELNLVRARLALTQSTNGISDFLKADGIIVSALAEPSGALGRYVIIENASTGFGAEKALLQQLAKGKLSVFDDLRVLLSTASQKVISALLKSLSITDADAGRLLAVIDILRTPFRFFTKALGTTADVYTLIQLTDLFNAKVLGISPDLEGLSRDGSNPIQLADSNSGVMNSLKVVIKRSYLVEQHAKAWFMWFNYGPMGTHPKKEPWSSVTSSNDVGKNVVFTVPNTLKLVKQRFFLRTENPPDPQNPAGRKFVDTDPNQAIMLSSPFGNVLSGVRGSEMYTLSYTDSIFPSTKPERPFFVWRVSARPDTDDIMFTLIGKVTIDSAGNVKNAPLKW